MRKLYLFVTGLASAFLLMANAQERPVTSPVTSKEDKPAPVIAAKDDKVSLQAKMVSITNEMAELFKEQDQLRKEIRPMHSMIQNPEMLTNCADPEIVKLQKELDELSKQVVAKRNALREKLKALPDYQTQQKRFQEANLRSAEIMKRIEALRVEKVIVNKKFIMLNRASAAEGKMPEAETPTPVGPVPAVSTDVPSAAK